MLSLSELREIKTQITTDGHIETMAANNSQLFTKFGFNPNHIKRYPNKIWNSSFNSYNPITLLADYWNGGQIEFNSSLSNYFPELRRTA